MNWKKIITLAVIAIVVYFLWRRFGDNVKSAISSATA